MRVPLGIEVNLAAALRALYDTERPFALVGKWAGGGALLGCAPVRTADDQSDPFAVLGGSQGGAGPQAGAGAITAADPGAGVGGGWVGYIGYPSRGQVDRGQPSPPRAQPLPPFSLAYYDHLVRLDGDGNWWFEALWSSARAAALEQRLAWWTSRLERPPQARAAATSSWQLTPGAAAHAELVAACRERIHAGDLFQANICAQLAGQIDGEPLELFIRGVEALRPDRAAFLEDSWGTVVSLSPELFLERRGREVKSAPIKGTRPRPEDPAGAASERATLVTSEKDRAENIMIVDLIRNDLGRVCEPGTIVAGPLAQAQAHAGVWHLVSEVRGTLRAGVDDGQLLRATFPPGSVTGAPKLAAIDVIAELESSEREVYTGAIGIASPRSGLELSVAIRTFEITGSSIRLGVGGGVVADSDPQAEADELSTKAAPLLRAVGALPLASGTAGRRLVPIRRIGPIPTPRPDPRRGVFETALVEDRQVAHLDAHLTRLRSSLLTLYGLDLPDAASERILDAAAAANAAAARMRVDAVPLPAGVVELTISVRPLEPQAQARLRAWTVPGGLGAHKWADRGLIDAIETHSPGEIPLLVDADGQLLETSRASIFVLGRDDVLRTPPDDGRILPGVTRALLIEQARRRGIELSTAPVGLEDLEHAQGVVLTSALRQIPAVALDGRELDRHPDLTELARSALRAGSAGTPPTDS